MAVEADSSKLLACNTPFGQRSFKRIPCGLQSASEVFQGKISKIICGIENAENSQEEIIIWGLALSLLQ